MTVLALETSGTALSVAVVDAGGQTLFAAFQRRRRGHAEALMPLVERALATAGIAACDLSLLAVSTGPGTFTGVRIGLAAARGLKLALGIPLAGIGSLDCIATSAGRRRPSRPVMAAIDARREQVYVQVFGPDDVAWRQPWTAPAAMSARAAAAMLVDGSVLAGSGAALVADHVDCKVTVLDQVEPEARTVARLALWRGGGAAGAPAPKPLYLRAPDAVPQAAR